jgi:hypothetical protein
MLQKIFFDVADIVYPCCDGLMMLQVLQIALTLRAASPYVAAGVELLSGLRLDGESSAADRDSVDVAKYNF